MSSNLPVRLPGQTNFPPSAPTDNLARAADYAAAEKAAATRRAYRSDFRDFESWCGTRELIALPASPETAAAYFAHLADAGRKTSTINRKCAAIAYAHKLSGFETPTLAEPVKAVLRGIRRTIGTAVERKAPVMARSISAMLRKIPDTLAGKRDRALLLIGFSAALRRGELAALETGDIERTAGGIIIHVRRSKTDQEGQGHQIAVPHGSRLKPVEALDTWLEARKINQGNLTALSEPLFVAVAKGGRLGLRPLSGRAVAMIIKRWAKAAKLDPALFSGHSLRAGFVTEALEHGADPFKVMDVTQHKRVDTLRVYDRRAKAFKNHAGKAFL
jgi:site-specific recombinase XerD